MKKDAHKDLLDKIYDELDMIHALAKMTRFMLDSGKEDLGTGQVILVFRDIEERYSKIFELLEQLEHEFGCLNR